MHSKASNPIEATINIPNLANQRLGKVVRIELSYRGPLTRDPDVSVTADRSSSTSLIETSSVSDTGSGWTNLTSTWRVYQQPSTESCLYAFSKEEVGDGRDRLVHYITFSLDSIFKSKRSLI